jgi:tetratricopeptide (TPR) repeat protein
MEASETLSYVYYKRGKSAMAQKRFEDAIVVFIRSIAIEPHFKTLELLGECYQLLNRPKEAIVPLAAASTLNDQIRAPALLSKVLLDVGDHRRALDIARRVLHKSPSNKIALGVVRAIDNR